MAEHDGGKRHEHDRGNSGRKKGAYYGKGSALVVFRRPVQLDRDPVARRDSSIRRREHSQ